MSAESYHHGIFISDVISRVDDLDSFAPIHTERRPEDVDGSPTLVPLDRRFGLYGAMRLGDTESIVRDQLACLGDQFSS